MKNLSSYSLLLIVWFFQLGLATTSASQCAANSNGNPCTLDGCNGFCAHQECLTCVREGEECVERCGEVKDLDIEPNGDFGHTCDYQNTNDGASCNNGNGKCCRGTCSKDCCEGTNGGIACDRPCCDGSCYTSEVACCNNKACYDPRICCNNTCCQEGASCCGGVCCSGKCENDVCRSDSACDDCMNCSCRIGTGDLTQFGDGRCCDTFADSSGAKGACVDPTRCPNNEPCITYTTTSFCCDKTVHEGTACTVDDIPGLCECTARYRNHPAKKGQCKEATCVTTTTTTITTTTSRSSTTTRSSTSTTKRSSTTTRSSTSTSVSSTVTRSSSSTRT